jgi:hypothetical protein
MRRMLTRTGIGAMALAGTVLACGALPAHAQARPGTVGGGIEVVTYFYNNAAHTTIIGAIGNGCVRVDWGTTSSYQTSTEFTCGD